ncbi:YnfU family zinc-binding protein [Enterobacter mori]|uniref:YnfU family zinc-binding protein n=3 Tax=Enterobacteriaceae TaxID=543 RepID=UPI002852E3E5|nr:YnfU family zinc-binding protein [Enterobacter mori]
MITFFIYHHVFLGFLAPAGGRKGSVCSFFLPLSKLKQALYCLNVYCNGPFELEMSMSARKNTQFRRSYLVKCLCPNCSKDSEHSYSRVQKGAQLVCPYCSALFKSSQRF